MKYLCAGILETALKSSSKSEIEYDYQTFKNRSANTKLISMILYIIHKEENFAGNQTKINKNKE